MTDVTAGAGLGELDRRPLDLEPIRRRLADLPRSHTPADVADAMRAEGWLVTDDSWCGSWRRCGGRWWVPGR